MSLTAAQRAEINRRNAQKSTGPKTDDGKAASRRNATRHGLRAEVLSLPDEDPALASARAEAWNDYYQPQSPAAQHLVNACVAATLLSDRCQRYHNAALSKQVRDARHAWDSQKDSEVEALALLIKTDPDRAIHRLYQFGHGCRWLIERWEELAEALEERGQWTGPERDEAIRLQGFHAQIATFKNCPEAWLTHLFALLCRETPSGAELQWLFLSNNYPELHRDNYRVDWLPDREECQRSLRAMVAERLGTLRDLEATYQSRYDTPDRAEAGDRALLLHDGPSARLFLRYHSEARNAFQRAYSALVPTLQRDADAAEAPNSDSSPNEANLDRTPDDETASGDICVTETALVPSILTVESPPQPVGPVMARTAWASRLVQDGLAVSS